MLIRSRISRRTSLVRSTELAAKKLFTALTLLVLLVSGVSSASLLSSNTSNAVAQAPAAGVWDQVATGYSHSCGIAYGEAYCWGEGDYGQLGDGTTIPTRETPVKVTQAEGLLAGKTVTQISAGNNFTCAIADGEAYCWGANFYWYGALGDGTQTQRTTPIKVVQAEGLLAGKTVTQISAGASSNSAHACAIADGEVYCWGKNDNGQLGDGTTTQRTVPVKVVQAEGLLAGKTVTQVATGSNYTCALADSEAYCWGYNNNGQLGDGTTTQRTVPVKVVQAEGLLTGKTVTQVATGYAHTCAIANNESYCWGNNTDGRLGDSTNTQRTSPVKVTQEVGSLENKSVTRITAGSSHSCALADAEVYCWGGNVDGQLGSGGGNNSPTPVKVTQDTGMLAGKSVTKLSANADHACAIANGEIFCWGDNWSGQLGYESNRIVLSPKAMSPESLMVLSDKNITQVSAGEAHTCAIADGEVYCWGDNWLGQLGDGTNTASSVPVKVVQDEGILAGKTVTQIEVDAFQSCAIADGEAYCWGDNWVGQIGDGTKTNRSRPVKVAQEEGLLAGKTITKLAVNWSGVCALAEGEVYCWGNNSRGQLGDSTTVEKLTPVKVTQAEGLLAGKTVTQVTAGSAYVCAIANGEAYCWGENDEGQLGDGTTVNRSAPVKVTQAAGFLAGKTATHIAGDSHTCVIADGEVFCWGLNRYNGTLGDGTDLDSHVPVKVVQSDGILANKIVTQLDVGEAHSCVVANNETFCWGGNWYGQLGDSYKAVDYSNTPVKVDQKDGILASMPVTQLTAGEWQNCAIAEGGIYCWGANFDGQLGIEENTSFLVPIRLPYLLPAAYINSTTGIERAPSTTPVEIHPRPTFNGRAQPNSTVVVTVHSDPVTCTATANNEGCWECTLADDLPEGEHTVYVQVTTPTGDVTNFGPYAIVVAAGASGGATTITSDTLLAETGISVPVLVSLALSLLAIGAGVLFRHKRSY